MRTLRVRIKDKHAKALDAMACECNLIWNYVNELSYKHLQRTGRFFSAYDIAKYTAGVSKEGLKVHSQTVQGVTEEYVTRRKQFKKAKLRWRVSRGSRKSLGWIPFKVGAVAYHNGQLRYAGQFFSLWDSYGLADYKLRSGSFSQDARGRWYANVCVEVEQQKSEGASSVGIDLGLKDFATLSTGEKIGGPAYLSWRRAGIGRCAAGKRERAREGNPRTDSKPQERLSAQTQHPARQGAWCDLRWQRERFRPGENQDGEIRFGCGLDNVPNNASV